jgi:hypothetical protein
MSWQWQKAWVAIDFLRPPSVPSPTYQGIRESEWAKQENLVSNPVKAGARTSQPEVPAILIYGSKYLAQSIAYRQAKADKLGGTLTYTMEWMAE